MPLWHASRPSQWQFTSNDDWSFKRRRDYLVPELLGNGLRDTGPARWRVLYLSGLQPFQPATARSSPRTCSNRSSYRWCRATTSASMSPKRYLRLSYATAMPKLQEAIGRMRAIYWRRILRADLARVKASRLFCAARSRTSSTASRSRRLGRFESSLSAAARTGRSTAEWRLR